MKTTNYDISGDTYKNGPTIIPSCLMINVVRYIGNTYFDVLNKTVLINVEFCRVYAEFYIDLCSGPLTVLKLCQTGRGCVKI